MKQALAIVVGVCGLIHSLAWADEIIVNWNGSGDFTTIQAAIDDAGTTAGDVVIVRPGTYVENINLNGKAITLRSTDPTNPAVVLTTILDGNASGSVITCNSDEETDTVINGFVITNGAGINDGSFDYGGGMYNESSCPTVSNCTFTGNTAFYGGGMYSESSSSTIINCTFSGNTAPHGGGMYNESSSPTITNCTFSDNTAAICGGLYNNSSSPTVTDCSFIRNSAINECGGLQNYNFSSPTLINCTFSNNSGLYGGGIYNLISSSPTVLHCTFSNNIATYGGAICNASLSSPTLNNCTFSGNTANEMGGGMWNDSSSPPTVTGCVFCQNTPNQIVGALHADSQGNAIDPDLCVSPRATEPPVFGDSDGDGDVDMIDFAAFAENWLVGTEL